MEEGVDVFWSQSLKNGIEEGAICSWSSCPFIRNVFEEVREHLSTWPNQDDSKLWPCRYLDGVVYVLLLQQELLSRKQLLEEEESAVVLLGKEEILKEIKVRLERLIVLTLTS